MDASTGDELDVAAGETIVSVAEIEHAPGGHRRVEWKERAEKETETAGGGWMGSRRMEYIVSRARKTTVPDPPTIPPGTTASRVCPTLLNMGCHHPHPHDLLTQPASHLHPVHACGPLAPLLAHRSLTPARNPRFPPPRSSAFAAGPGSCRTPADPAG